MHIIICIFVVFCSVMCWLCLFRTHRTNNKESRADVLCATANSWNALKSVIWYGLGPKAEDAAAIGGDKCSSMFRSWLKAHDEHSRHVQCANKEQPPHTHIAWTFRLVFLVLLLCIGPGFGGNFIQIVRSAFKCVFLIIEPLSVLHMTRTVNAYA